MVLIAFSIPGYVIFMSCTESCFSARGLRLLRNACRARLGEGGGSEEGTEREDE